MIYHLSCHLVMSFYINQVALRDSVIQQFDNGNNRNFI